MAGYYKHKPRAPREPGRRMPRYWRGRSSPPPDLDPCLTIRLEGRFAVVCYGGHTTIRTDIYTRKIPGGILIGKGQTFGKTFATNWLIEQANTFRQHLLPTGAGIESFLGSRPWWEIVP